MSAFVINLTRKSATIYSDTLMSHRDGTETVDYGMATKLFQIPHRKLVFCPRGSYDVSLNLFRCLMLSTDARDADELIERVPEMARMCTEDYAYRIGIDDHTKNYMFEAIFFWWSERDKQMQSAGFINSVNNFERKDYGFNQPGVPFMMPGLGSLRPDVKGLGDDAAAKRIFRAYSEAKDLSGFSVGGEMLKTEVSENGVATRTIHRFDGYAAAIENARTIVVPTDAKPEFATMAEVETAMARVAVPDNVVQLRPEPVPTMNRHQKRQAEKAARKAGKGRR